MILSLEITERLFFDLETVTRSIKTIDLGDSLQKNSSVFDALGLLNKDVDMHAFHEYLAISSICKR